MYDAMLETEDPREEEAPATDDEGDERANPGAPLHTTNGIPGSNQRNHHETERQTLIIHPF